MKKAYQILSLMFYLVFASSCANRPLKALNLNRIEVIAFKNVPTIGVTKAGQNIFLGGFSALEFVKKDQDKLFFYTLTDRGPNAGETELQINNKPSKVRPFLLPNFSPLLVQFSYDLNTKNIQFLSQQPLRQKNSELMNGFPPIVSAPDKTADAIKVEMAVDVFGKVLKYKNSGIDAEGFCKLSNSFLVSDEYGPDLLQLDNNLKLMKRWGPGKGLPAEFSLRKVNRGLEALSCDGEFAYAMLQSPLKNPQQQANAPLDQNNIRLIQFSLTQNKFVNQYFYPVNPDVADKIGDMTWINKKSFLILEQNGKLGPKKGVQQIYRVHLDQAASNGQLTKELVVDLNALGFDFAEKLEGLSIIDAKTLAVITDNDFGLEGSIDFTTGQTKFRTETFSYLVLIHLEKSLY